MKLSRRAKRRCLALLVVVGIGLLAGVGVLAGRSLQTARVHQARAEGLSVYREGDYQSTLEKLEPYARDHQGDTEVMLAYADARSRVPADNDRHLFEAAQCFRSVLKLEPTNRHALEQLFRIEVRLRRHDESMKVAGQLLELEPDHIEALSATAIGLFTRQRFDESVGVCRRLLELEPDALSWRALWISCLRVQNVEQEEILALCDAWISEDDGDGRLHLLKSDLLLQADRREEAAFHALAAMKRGAASLETLERILKRLDQLGLEDSAQELLATTKTSRPDESWPFEAAVRRSWQRRGVHDGLAELRDAEQSLGEFGPPLLCWRALLHTLAGNAEQARVALTLLADDRGSLPESGSPLAARIMAIRAHAGGDRTPLAERLEAYRSAISLSPSDPIPHYLCALAYAESGEHELAATTLEYVLRISPDWSAARIAYAEALLALGLPRRALESVREVMQRSEELDLRATLVIAQTWIAAERAGARFHLEQPESGRKLDIIGLLQTIHAQRPFDPTVVLLLADACLLRDQHQVLRELVQGALELDDPGTGMLLALVPAAEQATPGLGQRLVARARRDAGPTFEVAVAQADVWMNEGRSHEGIELVQRAYAATRAMSQDTPAMRRQRIAFLERAEHPDVSSAIREMLEEEPDSASASLFVLSADRAWDDPDLITAAIDQLSANLGDSSIRVALARARYLARFRSENPADLARATQLALGVLKRLPHSLDALTLMSSLLLSGQEPDIRGAASYLQRAVESYPERVDLYPDLIRLLQRHGDFAGARRYLARLDNRADADPAMGRVAAELHAAQGDFTAAATRFSSLVALAPSEDDQLTQASLLLRAGRYDEAEAVFTRLLETQTVSARAARDAARFYANRGQMIRGIEVLRQHAPGGENAANALMLAELYLEQSYHADAVEWFQRALEQEPDDVHARIQLTLLHLKTQDFARARDGAVAGLAFEPSNVTLQIALAIACRQLEDCDEQEVSEPLERMNTGDPAVAEALSLFDQSQLADLGAEPSADDLVRARQLVRDFPNVMPAWRLAVSLHVRAGELESAATMAKQATNRLPRSSEAARMATRVFIDAGRLREAVGMAREWRRRSLDRPLDADLSLASLRFALGEPAAAMTALEPHAMRLVVDKERFPDRFMLWLRALIGNDQFERSFELIQPCLIDQRWRSAWLQLAPDMEPLQAHQALLLVEAHLSDHPGEALSLASAWHRLARRPGVPDCFDRADALAQRAAASGQYRMPATLLRGMIAETRRSYAVAESCYREVLASHPDNVIALNNIALVMLRLGRDLGEVRVYSSKALQLAPNQPTIYDTQAQVLLAEGHPREAEDWVRRALAIEQGVPSYRITMAKALLAQDRPREAVHELDRARAILDAAAEPDPDLRQEIEDLQRRMDEVLSTDRRGF